MKHSKSILILTIAFNSLTCPLMCMDHRNDLPIPSLRDLALSTLTRHLNHLIDKTDATTLVHDHTTIADNYIARLPYECHHELTVRLGRYQCRNTVTINKPSTTSLLLTRLCTLVNSFGKKITLHDIHDTNQEHAITTFDAHSAAVSALAVIDNLLISGSHDTTIKFWDITDPKTVNCINTLTAHEEPIRRLMMGRNGTALCSVADHSIIVWDISDPRDVQQCTAVPVDARTIRTLTTTPDDFHIMYGEQNKIKILDIHDLHNIQSQEITLTDKSLITALAATNQLLAAGSTNKKIMLYKRDAAGPLTRVTILKGHRGNIQTLTFTDDGTLLVSGSSDKKIKLWNTANPHQTTHLKTLLGHKGTIKKLHFLHNNALLISISDDNAIKIWDITDPQYAACINTLHGHSRFISDLTSYTTTADEKILLSKGADNTIKIWEQSSLLYALCVQAIQNGARKKQIPQIKECLDRIPSMEKSEKNTLLQLIRNYT